MAVHYRIHRANALTWCGLRFNAEREARLNIETQSQRYFDLLALKFLPNGRVDYTPLTRSEKAEIRAERERLATAVTCKRCRAKMGWA